MNFYDYKCRACRIETKNCVDMNKPFGNASTLTIVECMNLCTGVPASQSDGLPNHICIVCNDELRTTYNFIQKVRESDEIFLREFKLTVISDPLFVDQNAENPTDINLSDMVGADFNAVEPKVEIHMDDVRRNNDEPASPWDGNLSGDFEASNDSNWADNFQKDDGFSDSSDDKPLIETRKTRQGKSKPVKGNTRTRRRAKKIKEEGEISDDNKKDSTAGNETDDGDSVPKKKSTKRKGKSTQDPSEDEFMDFKPKKGKKRILNEDEIEKKAFIIENTEILPPHKVEDSEGKIQEEQQLRCKLCGKISNNKHRLATHIKFVHMKIRNFLCTLCPKMFFNQLNLDTHMNTHNGIRPMKCDECGRGFTSKLNLDAHKRTHSDDRPFSCTVCGKAFKFETSIRGHMFTHTRKGHECKECGKNFAQPADLRRHALSHTGEKPYKCDLCPSIAYQHSSTLIFHMKKHNYSGASCNVCYEELSSFDDWRAHKNMHKKPTN